MSDNKVSGLLGASMDKIKEMVDVNTVVGDPITTPDGTTIIPISRVNYGFAGGGSDLPSKNMPAGGLFAGGSGAAVTVSPVAFLSISKGNVRVIQIEPYFSPVDRALEKIPDIADMFSQLFKREKEEDAIEEAVEKKEKETVDQSASE